jgi:hypothetical protein
MQKGIGFLPPIVALSVVFAGPATERISKQTLNSGSTGPVFQDVMGLNQGAKP